MSSIFFNSLNPPYFLVLDKPRPRLEMEHTHEGGAYGIRWAA
jgi:hypothetical protein